MESGRMGRARRKNKKGKKKEQKGKGLRVGTIQRVADLVAQLRNLAAPGLGNRLHRGPLRFGGGTHAADARLTDSWPADARTAGMPLTCG